MDRDEVDWGKRQQELVWDIAQAGWYLQRQGIADVQLDLAEERLVVIVTLKHQTNSLINTCLNLNNGMNERFAGLWVQRLQRVAHDMNRLLTGPGGNAA